MSEREQNSNLAPAYTWMVLIQLEQHRKAVRDGCTVKIKELAFNCQDKGPKTRQRAAEELAVPMMNLYSALGQADLAGGMTVDRARRMIVNVLTDGEKTVEDLSTAFDTCYRFRQPKTVEMRQKPDSHNRRTSHGNEQGH